MATTTPNYGWTVPTSTDLVKDGATAIETLGDAIDASMNTALGTKKAGMVLLNTTSFSAVSSVSLAANTFTSTYDHYRLMIQYTGTSGELLYWRGRTAGSDNSTGNYDWRSFYNDRTTLGVNTGVNNATAGVLGDGQTVRGITDCDIYNPQATQQTIILAKSWFGADDNSYGKQSSSQFDDTTSFDALTFYPNLGTITGTYYVYGYQK
jgi:hypothetical protein